MTDHTYRDIIELVRKAARLARSRGIPNLLQPGLVKEMMIADLLGHELIHSKRDADAHAVGRPGEKYEYLSCKEGLTGQMDRMFKAPLEKRQASLRRIARNERVYLAIFYQEDQTRRQVIYELHPSCVTKETERQLDASKNAISHVGSSERWAKKWGTVVYSDESIG